MALVLAVREPTGADEVFVVETSLAPMPALLELARRVTAAATGDPLDWASLPATDLDAAALVIRQSWIGDTIRTDAMCPAQGCGERIDVSFGIDAYLEHHRPRRPRGVTEAADDGWFTLVRAPVRFRIPTVADLLAARIRADSRRRLFPAVASTLLRYRGRSPGAWTARSPASRRPSTTSSAGPAPHAGTR